MAKNDLFGSIRGIVETLEQKSGLNSLLFIIAVISLPSLVLYSLKSQPAYLWFAGIPIGFAILIYAASFVIDRDFLRSEKHTIEKKQLEIMLGEKNKELPGENILDIDQGENPEPKNDKKLTGGKDV